MAAQQFLARRFAALSCGDYASVYESYHHDAPFLQQFTDPVAYLHFARQQLSEIQLKSWRCLRQRSVADKQLEVLLVMEIATAGELQYFYELALLIETEAGWRYHSAQKLDAEDYSGLPEQIDFCHFDDASQKIRL